MASPLLLVPLMTTHMQLNRLLLVPCVSLLAMSALLSQGPPMVEFGLQHFPTEGSTPSQNCYSSTSSFRLDLTSNYSDYTTFVWRVLLPLLKTMRSRRITTEVILPLAGPQVLKLQNLRKGSSSSVIHLIFALITIIISALKT